MSRETPRFKSSQSIQERNIPTGAAGARGFSDLGRQIQKFAQDNFLKERVREAEQLGGLAGLSENVKEVRGGAAADAFNRAALATNKQMIGSDVILRTSELKNQALNENRDASQALDAFTKNMQQFTSELVKNVPDSNRAYAQNMAAYHMQQTQMSMQDMALKQQKVRSNAMFMQQDSIYRDDTLSAIQSINYNIDDPEQVSLQEGAAQHVLTQRLNGLNLAKEGGIITEQEAVKLSENSLREFNNEMLSQKYKSLLIQGDEASASKMLRKLQESPPKGFTSFQTTELINRLRGISKSFQNASQQSNALLRQQMKDEMLAVKSGANPNERLRTLVAESFPNQLSLYDQQIEDAQIVHSFSSNLVLHSFDEQEEILNRFQPRDKDDPEFGRKLRLFEDVKKLTEQANNRIMNDPAAYFLGRPEIMNDLNDAASVLNSGVNFNVIEDNGYRPITADPLHRLVAAQRQKGLFPDEVSVLTNQQAKTFVSRINSMPPQERIFQFREWQDEYGDTYPIFMRNLIRQGNMSDLNVFLAGMEPNDSRLPQVVQSIDTPHKELENALRSINPDKLRDLNDRLSMESSFPRDFRSFVASMQGFKSTETAEYLSNFRNFVRNVAMSMMISDRSLSAKNAFRDASDVITGAFEYTSIGGKDIAVPKQFSVRDIRSYAREKAKRELEDFVKSPNFVSSSQALLPGTSKADDFKLNIRTGGWVNNPSNTGLVWVNQYGTAIRDRNGNTFEFDFNDAVGNYDSSLASIRPRLGYDIVRTIARSLPLTELGIKDVAGLVSERIRLSGERVDGERLTREEIEERMQDEMSRLTRSKGKGKPREGLIRLEDLPTLISKVFPFGSLGEEIITSSDIQNAIRDRNADPEP